MNILDVELAKGVGDFIARFCLCYINAFFQLQKSLLGHSSFLECCSIDILYDCSCQTYEGGIAGEPYAEAHGGYVSEDFCKVPNLYVKSINKSCFHKVYVLWIGCFDPA